MRDQPLKEKLLQIGNENLILERKLKEQEVELLLKDFRIKELEDAIRKCLKDNAHLADGDVCTLIDLKRVL